MAQIRQFVSSLVPLCVFSLTPPPPPPSTALTDWLTHTNPIQTTKQEENRLRKIREDRERYQREQAERDAANRGDEIDEEGLDDYEEEEEDPDFVTPEQQELNRLNGGGAPGGGGGGGRGPSPAEGEEGKCFFFLSRLSIGLDCLSSLSSSRLTSPIHNTPTPSH
jgi:hypothetical protein